MKSIFLTTFVLLFIFNSNYGFGWGQRGHHAICEVATHLVKDPALLEFLKPRALLQGHVCNIPDISWRDAVKNLPHDKKEAIDDSHHVNPEKLGYTHVSLLPTSLDDIIADHKNMKRIDVALQLGSLWWRANQFYDRVVSDFKTAKKNSRNVPDQVKAFTNAVNSALINGGLQGHFVGDAAMPYHNTEDYDGWKTGRGGIHSYYESESVEAISLQLLPMIENRAIQLRDEGKLVFLEDRKTPVERMKALSILAYDEIKEIEKLDPMTARSIDKKNKDDRGTKAQRPRAKIAGKVFETLIVTQLARAALLQAHLWELAWIEAGKPDLSHFHSYDYPLSPAVVELNYLN